MYHSGIYFNLHKILSLRNMIDDDAFILFSIYTLMINYQFFHTLVLLCWIYILSWENTASVYVMWHQQGVSDIGVYLSDVSPIGSLW